MHFHKKTQNQTKNVDFRKIYLYTLIYNVVQNELNANSEEEAKL